MQFLAELTSSEILVAGMVAIFAVIILASIYIHIRRNLIRRIPNVTRRKVFWFLPRKDPSIQEVPLRNNEVVSNARPVTRDASQSQEFDFGFDDDELPEQVAADPVSNGNAFTEPQTELTDDIYVTGNGEAQTDDPVSSREPRVVHWQDALPQEDSSAEDAADVAVFAKEYDEATSTFPSWEHAQEVNGEQTDAYSIESDVQENSDFADSGEGSHFENEHFQNIDEDEPGSENGVGQEYLNNDDLSSEGLFTDLDSSIQTSDIEQDSDSVEEMAIDRKSAEVLRVEPPSHEPQQTFVVVSVCLMSEFNNQVYRDIRGKKLKSFLQSWGFILLDEEYHLQKNAMVEAGGIRVRNFEKTPIGDVVKSNDETRGFRLYFRPSDSEDPLQTLNEMLKIAQSATGYFRDTCKKPLVIYDGRKPVKPLTQEGYSQLKLDLLDAFPRNLANSPKRTALSRNDYTPSDDLPNRAEMN